MPINSGDERTLYVTPQAKMLHTTECPHLDAAGLSALRRAKASEIAELPTCSSCQDILDGGRRLTFASVDAAMESLPMPLENRARVRKIASELTFSQVWIPASKAYIAVAEVAGSPAVAYFNKGFVDVRLTSGGYHREFLPRTQAGDRRSGAADERPVALCPTCHTQLPASGQCDTCDA